MAINPTDFYNHLVNHDINFFSGVPDSLLKEFCLCIDDSTSKDKHIITANEGNAIALATGYYLATESLPLVYMQNSGLGNAINPLLSLCDSDVYSIPMLVMIGWRGEPGLKDEPQHIKQGKVQLKLLKSMDIPYEIISKDDNLFPSKISNAVKIAKNKSIPVVLLIKRGTFEKYGKEIKKSDDTYMEREKALAIILDSLDDNTIVVSTTGKTSREIFEIRKKRRQSHQQDFLTVGSMGHCSSIALGIAISNPKRKVVCIDGDGSLIMHMGSLSTVGNIKPKNFYHILINNEVHESVGGQTTSARFINIPEIVKASGYSNVLSIDKTFNIAHQCQKLIKSKGPNFLEIKVKPGSREDLGRPTIDPVDNKINFMKFVSKK
jgi:phosphonopyruvate decarboxylase